MKLNPRFRPVCYRCFLVRPLGDFSPRSWQDCPKHFAIIERVKTSPLLGKVDAWKWLHNTQAIERQSTDCWAIHLNS